LDLNNSQISKIIFNLDMIFKVLLNFFF